MAKLKIIEVGFYKQRHVVSFIGLVVALLLLLGIAGLFVPGGVSSSERQSTVDASAIQWGTFIGKYPEQIAHLPYHLLQRASTEVFSVSQISIKLPSLLLGLLSILALYQVLGLWFKRNVALITAVVAATCGQFLLLTQLGAPRITYIFLSVGLLFCASMLTQTIRFRNLWFILTALMTGLAMYTPMLCYLVAVLIVIGLIHPHSRFIIFRVSTWALLLATALFAFSLIPLGMAIAKSPDVVMQFLGANSGAMLPSITHLKELMSQYVGFMSSSSTEVITPAYGLGIMLLVAIGFYRLFTVKYTAKSYIITSWVAILIPAILLFPTATTLTFVPIMLLVAFAFDYLFRYWYRMFPLNPYARVAGLIPLAVLIVALAFSNASRFVYGYHYNADAVATFSTDVLLLDGKLSTSRTSKTLLSVTPANLQFYTYYLKTNSLQNVAIATTPLTKELLTQYAQVITDKPYSQYVTNLATILVSDSGENAGRFYIYKNSLK